MSDCQNYFTEDGNIREDINIHDKEIPCMIRLGYLYTFCSPCDGCLYCGWCRERATDEYEKYVRERYPKVFSGEIQTRKEYIEYMRYGGG